MSSDTSDRTFIVPIFVFAEPQDDSRGLRDGEVVLYRRPESTRWQARFKLPDNTWHRVSTKRTNIREARRIACEAYDRARFRFEAGNVAVSRRFRDVAAKTGQNLRQALVSGQGKSTFKDYIEAIDNYLKPFFGNKPIDQIEQEDLERFEMWRTKKMGRVPAASTVTNHTSAFNRVFDTALSEGWISKEDIPVIKNRGKKGTRRPDFTFEEWNKLRAGLPAWVEKASNARALYIRELLWDYVEVLANTGMRPGTEPYNLKWKQIRWHEDKSNAERYLMIAVKGKTGYRELVARHGTEQVLGRIQSRFPDLAAMPFDDLVARRIDLYVFRLRTGARTNEYSRAFAALLSHLGLLLDSQGSHRTLYSLRHTYATLRLAVDKVPIHSLAKQMGTSVGMLEKHYSHLEPVMQAEVFAGKKHEK